MNALRPYVRIAVRMRQIGNPAAIRRESRLTLGAPALRDPLPVRGAVRRVLQTRGRDEDFGRIVVHQLRRRARREYDPGPVIRPVESGDVARASGQRFYLPRGHIDYP